jgi:hypothetical protein
MQRAPGAVRHVRQPVCVGLRHGLFLAADACEDEEEQKEGEKEEAVALGTTTDAPPLLLPVPLPALAPQTPVEAVAVAVVAPSWPPRAARVSARYSFFKSHSMQTDAKADKRLTKMKSSTASAATNTPLAPPDTAVAAASTIRPLPLLLSRPLKNEATLSAAVWLLLAPPEAAAAAAAAGGERGEEIVARVSCDFDAASAPKMPLAT